jgi:hypothetical protein
MDMLAVRSSLGLTLLADTPIPLTVQLEYRTDDPYAVHALFEVPAGEPVRWVFARDLLDEGLVHPVGDGDVHVGPTTDPVGRNVVQIELSSPEGTAVLEASADDVLGFLERCYSLVPPGDEPTHLDLDTALVRLLHA